MICVWRMTDDLPIFLIVLDSLGTQSVVVSSGEKMKTTTYRELMGAVYISDNRYMGILKTDTSTYLILIGDDGNGSISRCFHQLGRGTARRVSPYVPDCSAAHSI